MPLFQSKPSTIEAVQWTGDGEDAVRFGAGKVRVSARENALTLLAGKDGAQEWVPVPLGHWLVNQPGDKSDIWPVDPDYFAAKYEPADGEPQSDGTDVPLLITEHERFRVALQRIADRPPNWLQSDHQIAQDALDGA